MNQIFGMDKFNSITKYQPTQNAKKAEHTNSTIGNPKLSEKAESYYEELKAKYGDVDFVLVSNDKKEQATELAANHKTNKSMTVLISEDEVEEMATNTTTRAENEKIIEDAKSKIPELFEKLKESGTTVKSFGMQFNDDGTTSYFAVVDKSLAAQKERLEQDKNDKADNKKISDKDERTNSVNRKGGKKAEDLTTVTASSMEELIQKLTDSNSSFASSNINNVMTQQEKMVGQHFDFRW